MQAGSINAELMGEGRRSRMLRRASASASHRARQARDASVLLRQRNSERRHAVRAQLDQFQDQVDRLRAWRTVPRGQSASDTRSAPGVELGLWLLHVRYARSHDPAVRVALVEEYGGYAASLARRLLREGESLEDLVQVAMEALLVSLERFDPERGIPFLALATPTILGSLKRHYRDLGWAIRVPRKVHDIAAPARDAADRLTASLGRSPTVPEVAAELGIDEDALLAAQEATSARSVVSLDAVMGDDEPRGDLIGSLDPRMVLAENRVALKQALVELSDRERTVVGMYYFEERSQADIAEVYGVSQMQVSRWLSGTLRRLRNQLKP